MPILLSPRKFDGDFSRPKIFILQPEITELEGNLRRELDMTIEIVVSVVHILPIDFYAPYFLKQE